MCYQVRRDAVLGWRVIDLDSCWVSRWFALESQADRLRGYLAAWYA
jgi:hypothetical protein